MKEPENTTAAVLDINDFSLSLKARPDENQMNPSGWSIIAFAPSASIRCVRAHQINHLDLFIKSILALVGDTHMVDTHYELVLDTIHRITGGVFDHRQKEYK
tara:strand:+ start:574 stop:879 length:306 start_codon:yes stop_codon:yes gene_type:complete